MDSLFYFFEVVVVIVDYQWNVAHKNKSSDWCECVCACGWVFHWWKKHKTFAQWIVSFLIIHAFVTIKFWILKTSTIASVVFSPIEFRSSSSFSFMKINRVTFSLPLSLFLHFMFTHSPVSLSQPHLFWKPLFFSAHAVALKRWPWF